MADDRKRFPRAPQMKVVSHHPWRRGLTMLAVVVLTTGVTFTGYWIGKSRSGLDSSYVESLERLNAANTETLAELRDTLVEADLTGEVDQEAARTLRGSIRELRDEVASLTEEVTFYKSLMSPSSVARGLQIAEFELLKMERQNQFTYHILLTQVESRRDWVQGDVNFEVRGKSSGANDEQVLPLTEIGDGESYPLKYRFRYFQDLSGVITLPAGFEPISVVVTAARRGANTANLTRDFEWMVSGQEST